MTASRSAHIGFDRSFIAAMQFRCGSDDSFDVVGVSAQPDSSVVVNLSKVELDAARAEHLDISTLPCNETLTKLGLDLVLLSRVIFHKRLANSVVVQIVERVRQGTLEVADVNDVFAMILQVTVVRALHRAAIVREVLGFNNELIARAYQRCVLDGGKMRTLVHRVATGQLGAGDANMGIESLLPHTSGRIAA